VEAVGRVAAVDADHGVVDGCLEPHVQEVLGHQLGRVAQQGGHGEGVLVGDHGRVAADAGTGAAAAAVPVATAVRSRAAAKAASQLRVCACRRRVDGTGPWRDARISPPRARRIAVVRDW
jgi:hypothetical protein